MTGFDILEAMGKIDDRFLEEDSAEIKTIIRKRRLKYVTAFAACVCVIIAIGFNMNNTPNILIPANYITEIQFDTMGYEGTNNLSLQNSWDINPYSAETLPETLPVFKNLCYSGGLYQNYFSEEDLQNRIYEIAESLGKNDFQFSIVKAEIDTDNPNYKENLIYNVIGESEQFHISVNGGAYSISPKTAEASQILNEYLYANYDMEFLGEHNAYSVDGEFLSIKFTAYKKGATAEENILNHSLSSAEIHLKDDTTIDFVLFNDYMNCAEKALDYRTIPLEKATNKLLLGVDVSTSTPEELIIDGKVQKEHIVKTDLIYYTGNLQQAFIPYYRFYVKLINPDESSDIENYGLFYVPAVEFD